MNKSFRRSFTSLLLTTCILTFVGCNSKKEPVPTIAETTEQKWVTTTKVQEQTITETSQLSGTLESDDETVISFEVGGKILKLNKDVGDRIQIGDLLGKVEDQNYRIIVQKAESAVNQVNATIEKLNHGARPEEINQAKVVLEKAKASYDRDLEDEKKMQALFEQKAITEDTYNKVKLKREISEKDLKNAELALSLIQQGARAEDKAQANATLQQMASQRQEAALALQKTSLISPFSGTIISKLVSEGQLIGAGTPIYKVGKLDTLKVDLPVPDQEISRWSTGDKVELDLYGAKREGVVKNIHPSTNQGTGTIGVEVEVPNTDHKWFVGQVVKASHKVTGATGVFLPVEAIIRTGNEKPYVFTVAQGKAVKTSVEIGVLSHNKLEVKSGLSEGAVVVTKGADQLYDGDAVSEAAKEGTSK